MQEASRHPEVDQENATALEPNNEILASPLDSRGALAFELGCHLGRLVRTDQSRIVDRHALQASADKRGLELPADALDLRQLRHRASVVARRRRAERPTGPREAGRECRATAPCR